MREFDQYLGAYPIFPQTSYQKWIRLTNHITASLINRILPNQGKISNISGSTVDEKELQSGFCEDETNKYADEMIMFTSIELKRSWRTGAVGAELSKYSQDKSWLLNELLKSAYANGMYLSL